MKNLDFNADTMLIVLLLLAITHVFNTSVLLFPCLVCETIPVSIKFNKNVWSLVDILSISSIKRYLGLLSKIYSSVPAFVLLPPSVKYELLSFIIMDLINIVFAEAGGPIKSICTGSSAFIDILRNFLTSLYPMI